MSNESAKEWLNTKWPNMRACDVNWTMKRYDYPDYVCEYIKNNWIKISDSGGGTYHEPLNEHEIKRLQTALDPSGSWISGGNTHKSPNELSGILRNMVKDDDDGKEMAKLYQQTGFAKGMDENNKKALDVMAKEGMDAVAKHMMASAGGDYSRMRSMFG